MVKEKAHDALLTRLTAALDSATPTILARAKEMAASALGQARQAASFILEADEETRQFHARRLASVLADVTQGCLLLEEAARELSQEGSARKAAVAYLFCQGHLAPRILTGMEIGKEVLALYAPVVQFSPVEPGDLALT